MKEITIKLTFDKTWEHFKKQNHSDKVWVNTGLAVLTTGVSWEIESEKPNTNLWVSVEDKLPEEGGRYWCYVEELNDLGISHYEWNCYFDPHNKEFRDNLKTMKVTHWTYLLGSPNDIK
jgi:hypothetical protein